MASYDLTLAAEEDLRDIWRYTLETWGPEQADTYLDQLGECLDEIGSRRAPPRSLPQLPDELCIHRCQRHYIFWLAIDRPIIIAVLHEKMDILLRLEDRL
ncbi:MAG: type II toxin-antitoxin system RelE/ParE family toxin [Pseudomonadota bacterium]